MTESFICVAARWDAKMHLPELVVKKAMRDGFCIDFILVPGDVKLWIFCNHYSPTIDLLLVQRIHIECLTELLPAIDVERACPELDSRIRAERSFQRLCRTDPGTADRGLWS